MAKIRRRAGATKKVTEKVAKKRSVKTAKKTPTKKAAGTATKTARKAPTKTPEKASPVGKALSEKGNRAESQTSKKTVPGGVAPVIDDVTEARRHLRAVREIIERANDRDAELIVGEGSLEALLSAVVPRAGRAQKSVYEHLQAHKHRASLLARIRHGINDRSAFALPDAGGVVSPTRVQWFYDGLTFVEGSAPYSGVVGLYRDGVVRYGLSVIDAEKHEYLGPLASDFVSTEEAKKSFRSASGKADAGLARLLELAAVEAEAPANESRRAAWGALLTDHPWMLGGQHTAVTRLAGKGVSGDAELPEFVAKRASDGAHDILLVEEPSTLVVGKTGKVLASFRDIWSRAERLRTFVQRQSSYLQRELRLKIRDPRFIIIAGRGLSDVDRAVVRRELEVHHAAVRLVSYDALHDLAKRTHSFFEGRF